MSFNDLTDHPAVADQFRRSLERGRLAHAYLLTGARGAGKETVARTLAKALNCDRVKFDSCDECDSCRRIDGGHHPDVYWVRPELKSRRISVDQVREFERAANLKASQARIKVGIITEAECLGEEASNAFLKTLEEPPAQTVILLLAAEPQRLLPTILSRCLRVSLGPVAATASPYRERVLPLLLRFTGAGPRSLTSVYQLHAALTALLAELREEIRQRVEAEYDLDRYAELDPKTRDRLTTQMDARAEGEYRSAREQVLEEVYGWFGDVLLCVERGADEALEHPDHAAVLRQAAGRLSFSQATTQVEAIEQIRDAWARNVTEPLALEVGLLQLLATA